MGKATGHKPQDLAVIHGPTEDGSGAKVLRLRDGHLSAGEVRPVTDGQPLNDRELVRLKPMTKGSPVCEVEVLHGSSTDSTAASAETDAGQSRAGAGPARVTNAAYRRNWGQVFAKRTRQAERSSNRKRPKKDLSLN